VSCPPAPEQVTSEKGTRKSYISVSDSILQTFVQSMQLPAQKEQVDDNIILMSGFLIFTCILQHIFNSFFWYLFHLLPAQVLGDRTQHPPFLHPTPFKKKIHVFFSFPAWLRNM
jgi:hypothetical protein